MASSTPTRLVGVPQPAIKKAQLLLFVLCSFGEVCRSVVLAARASGRLQCADPPCERDLGLFVLQYCFLTSVCSAIAVACDERGSSKNAQAYKQFDAQNAQLPRRYTRRASRRSSPGSVPPPAPPAQPVTRTHHLSLRCTAHSTTKHIHSTLSMRLRLRRNPLRVRLM